MVDEKSDAKLLEFAVLPALVAQFAYWPGQRYFAKREDLNMLKEKVALLGCNN